jgi:hypothetical protein
MASMACRANFSATGDVVHSVSSFVRVAFKTELVIDGEREHRCVQGDRETNGEDVVVSDVLHV